LKPCTVYQLLSIFAGATPLGMFIGILVSSNSDPIVSGVLVSITVGTFLYIAASEVIVEEFAVTHY
jgi:zinc transporter 1/2/3